MRWTNPPDGKALMAEIKTKKTGEDPRAFISRIEDAGRRADALKLLTVLQEATGAEPKMWGSGIIGFGDYKYKSGKNLNDWFLAGFAARKQQLTVYLMSGYAPYADLMKKLGKHKTGGSCLYIKKLDDVDTKVLTDLVRKSTTDFKKKYLSDQKLVR